MEVSGLLHVPAALPPGKEPSVYIGWETQLDHRDGLDAVERKMNSLATSWNRNPLVQPVA
jgi:hypothetical protein